MTGGAGRRRLLARPARWAVGLWLTFAVVVWNVIFDRMLVLAGRRYSYEAYRLFHTTGRYLKIDDVMRPAVTHAAAIASLAAGLIAAAAMVLIRVALVRDRRKGTNEKQMTTDN